MFHLYLFCNALPYFVIFSEEFIDNSENVDTMEDTPCSLSLESPVLLPIDETGNSPASCQDSPDKRTVRRKRSHVLQENLFDEENSESDEDLPNFML